MGLSTLAKLELRFVHRTVDRHGNVYFHFRKNGCPRVRLKGEPGSAQFMDAYAMALGESSEKNNNNPHKIKQGSMAALVRSWYESGDFKRLRESSTQSVYRRTMDNFLVDHGHKPVALLEAKHVREIIAKKSKTPAAANQLLKRLKQVMRFALENDWIKVDPTQGVRRLSYQAKPIYTWSEQDAAKFLEAHASGSKAHLAFMILSHTGIRRSDAVKLGRGHKRGDTLVLEQTKTNVMVSIPIHPLLAATLEPIKDRLLYLQTEYGKPFTAAGFGNWFRDQCNKAGLQQCSAHGLRKLIATRLAEAGCNENTISAILGWQNNNQASLYTRAANKEKMARAGMKAIG
jgi:integrase